MIFFGFMIDKELQKQKNAQKNARKKKQMSSVEKEQKFIKTGSKLLTALVVMLCIVLGFVNVFSGDDDEAANFLQPSKTLTALFEACDVSQLVDDPITNDGKDNLINKIKTAGLDILENNNPNYDKFMQDEISLTADISFTSQEVALLYSYTFMNARDTYNMNIHQLTLKQSGGNVSMYSVTTLSFYNLFTKHVKNNYDENTLNNFPKKIYVVNECVWVNGAWQFKPVRINNLTAQESVEMVELLKTTSKNIKLDEYAPNLIINYLEAMAEKTNSTINYSNNTVEYKINNSN